MKQYADLLFASTLCGSCTNVCPVKINIHEQLYKWRQVIVKRRAMPILKKRVAMKAMEFTLSNPAIYKIVGKAGRMVMKYTPFMVNNKLNLWYNQQRNT